MYKLLVNKTFDLINKKFSSFKIKIWFEPMFFFRFFGSFYRCGSAAFPNFRGGISSSATAVGTKCVRTILSIPHQSGKVKSSRRGTRREDLTFPDWCSQ